jgi:hypothetical protein
MDQYKTCLEVDYSLLIGDWIDPPARAHGQKQDQYSIDPNMKYPIEFGNFMNRWDGTWDLYGSHSIAYEEFSILTYEEICDIFKKRQEIIIKKKDA